MADSVTFPEEFGGSGLTVTGDSDPNTGLGNGGHRERFVPALKGVVDMAAYSKGRAEAAAGYVDTVMQYRDQAQQAATQAAASQQQAAQSSAAAGKAASDTQALYGNAQALEAAVDSAQQSAGRAEEDAGRAEDAADRAESLATGVFRYRGQWDASAGAYPTNAVAGDYYRVSEAGEVNGIQYNITDGIVRNDAGGWDIFDNTDRVNSVNGKTGDVQIPVRTDEQINALIAAAKVLKVEEITESQDWSKDPRARLIIFQGVAPGAAGARSNSNSFNVSGGSGGQGFQHIYTADMIPDTLSVIMGSPGMGSTDSTSETSLSPAPGDIEVIGLFKALGGKPGAAYSDSTGLSRFSPPASALHEISTTSRSSSNFGMQHLTFYDSGYGGCGHNNIVLASGGNSNIGGGGGAGIHPSSASGFPGGKSHAGGNGGDSKAPGTAGGDGKFPGGGGAAAINAKPGNGGSGLLRVIQLG